MPRFHTVKSFAEELGVNQSKVAAWIASGELVALNIATKAGKKPRWRIRDSELERFLTARQSQLNGPAKATTQPRRQPSKSIPRYI